MTESTITTTTRTDEAFVPVGHPVARFVGVMAVVAALLVAVWWTGVFAARLTVSVTSAQIVTQAGPGVATIDVRNRGRVAAHVGFELQPSRFVQDVGAPLPNVATIGGAQTVTVRVRYRIDCAAYDRAKRTPKGVTTPELRFDVRAKMSGHTVHIREPLNGACGEELPTD
jgi:hypothetical protein